jgi:Oxidoreductase family, NAD-binding Rossmann fold
MFKSIEGDIVTSKYNPTRRASSNGKPKIRYAVVGLGYIAQVAVLPAFARVKNSELVAFVSGDSKKLNKLSKKYKVPLTFSYDQYDECLKSGEVDAVYIALPNRMHRDYTRRRMPGRHSCAVREADGSD